MRVAGELTCSFNNGDGVRYVVFVQGCAHRCPGCQNPETWDFNGGYEISARELAKKILARRMVDGLTLSGGDPLYQQSECIALVQLLREADPNYNIWVYTGFEEEEACGTRLGKMVNALVCGPYVEALKCEGKMYGSSNQKVVRILNKEKV